MTQVNLLPWREEAKQLKKTQFILITFGFCLIAAMLVLLIHMYYKKSIDNHVLRNNFLESELSHEQSHLNTLNDTNKEMLKAETALHFIFSLREASYRSIIFLDALAKLTPEAVSITKIEYIGKNILITGKAPSDSQVSLLMDNISKNKNFKQPNLSKISVKEDDNGAERIFQIRIMQQE